MKMCKLCKRIIKDDSFHIINADTNREFVVCEDCFGSMWEYSEITLCEPCGTWHENDMIISDPDIPDFAPCPSCGMDVISGRSRVEAIDDETDRLYAELNKIVRDIKRMKMIRERCVNGANIED